MKSLRKSILTLLALTLFGGAGAWAQGPTQVTEFTTDLIASWQTDDSPVTLADLQALGFVAVDESVAHAWTGAPQDNYSWLFYGFDEGNGYIMSMMFNHGNVNPSDQSSISKGDFYSMIAHGEKFFYTGAPNQAIELTKAGANQWSLGQAPDYDLEFQVEYYEAHALKDIPAGWQVMVNGVDKTSAIDHDSLMITETDSVTLVPAGNPRRVKSVTLEDEGPAVRTINVDGLQLNYVEGENWVQTAERNDDVLTTDSYYVFKKNSTIVLLAGEQTVSPTSTYDSSLNYYWEQW
jgi:hypothetical protein